MGTWLMGTGLMGTWLMGTGLMGTAQKERG
jgi:hypothetical protein